MTSVPPIPIAPEPVSPNPDPPKSESREPRVSPWVAFVAALQFLTITPPLVHRLFSDKELGASIAYFPVVGMLLGLLLAGVNVILGWLFPVEIATVMTLSTWIVLTGAIHMDGFLDSCDGLWGGRTSDERLSIMRDHRVGSYAVIGGILLILLKYVAIARLAHPAAAIVVACVVGRWLICWAILWFPYGRAQGLGKVMKDNARQEYGKWATAFVLVTVFCVSGFWGLTAIAVAAFVGFLVVRFSMTRLPGLTGDIYGTICELGEATVLVVWTVCEKGQA